MSFNCLLAVPGQFDLTNLLLKGITTFWHHPELQTLRVILASLLVLLVLVRILERPLVKGMIGEWVVRCTMKLALPRSRYRCLHNFILPAPDGFTQVDHVVVSRFGVFVVETKNYQGVIIGKPSFSEWIQFIGRSKRAFQNPIRQNYRHVKAIEQVTGLELSKIHSVVIFTGRARLKVDPPESGYVGTHGIRYIRQQKEPRLSEKEYLEVCERLTTLKLQTPRNAIKQHLNALKDRNCPSTPRSCTKCGEPMILREPKSVTKSFEPFWGCSAFPKCRYRQSVRKS